MHVSTFYGGISTLLFNSTEEHHTIIHNDRHCTDTLSPLSETPAAALATSDAFSSSSDIHPQCSSSVLALRQSSTLFVRALRRPLRPRPSSVRIRGTTFHSSIAELLPKIGTQFEMERKWRGNTKINTTINHRRTTTRARTNAGAVMSRGADGEGRSEITIDHP